MRLSRVLEFFFPQGAEREPDFRAEIQRLGRRSLYLISLINLAYAVAGYVLGRHLPGLAHWPGLQFGVTLAFLSWTALTLSLAKSRWGGRYGRPVALLSSFLVVVVLSQFVAVLVEDRQGAETVFLLQSVAVMLIAVAVVPARPAEMFLLGCAIVAAYLSSFWFGPGAQPGSVVSGLLTLAELVMLTTLGTILVAVNYRRLQQSYLSHQQAMRAQSHLLLAENAAGLGRLTAALSHELNSPLATSRSSAQTLLALLERLAAAPEDCQGDVLQSMHELCRTIDASTSRQKQIISRLQRFSNLDSAEVQPVDLNKLLEDVVALTDPLNRERVHIEFDLRSVRPVVCRPQQISAVLASLLGQAVSAIGQQGCVRISTACEDSQVAVSIENTGQGLSREELASLRGPLFQTSGKHVTSGSWSLFSSRRIIHEHGGELRVTSAPERGTRVVITLPRETAKPRGDLQ